MSSVKSAFTLMEVLFVIVVIALLGSVAAPKFMDMYNASKEVSAKGVVSSLRTSIETLHGEYVIDDSTDQAYPFPLDSATLNTKGEKLFTTVLKNPIVSCQSGGNERDCWYKESNKSSSETYGFLLNKNKILKLTYYETNGSLECTSGTNVTLSECEEIIDR